MGSTCQKLSSQKADKELQAPEQEGTIQKVAFVEFPKKKYSNNQSDKADFNNILEELESVKPYKEMYNSQILANSTYYSSVIAKSNAFVQKKKRTSVSPKQKKNHHEAENGQKEMFYHQIRNSLLITKPQQQRERRRKSNLS